MSFSALLSFHLSTRDQQELATLEGPITEHFFSFGRSKARIEPLRKLLDPYTEARLCEYVSVAADSRGDHQPINPLLTFSPPPDSSKHFSSNALLSKLPFETVDFSVSADDK